MLYHPSPQRGVSRLALLPVGEQTQLWLRNKPGPWTGSWRGLSGGQSCEAEPVTCGIWRCFQVGSFWIELNCRTCSGVRELLGVGKKSTYLTTRSARSVLCGLWLFSHSIMSDSLWLHGLQHARLPCPSLSHYLPGFAQTHVHWVGDAIQPSHPLSPLLLLPSVFPSIRVFSNLLVLYVNWPKYWNFSISPSNAYSGLISLQVWSPCSPRFSEESSPAPQFESISSSGLNLLYGPHPYTTTGKNHSSDCTDLCWQNDASAF